MSISTSINVQKEKDVQESLFFFLGHNQTPSVWRLPSVTAYNWSSGGLEGCGDLWTKWFMTTQVQFGICSLQSFVNLKQISSLPQQVKTGTSFCILPHNAQSDKDDETISRSFFLLLWKRRIICAHAGRKGTCKNMTVNHWNINLNLF